MRKIKIRRIMVVIMALITMLAVENTFAGHFSKSNLLGNDYLPIILPAGVSPQINGVGLDVNDEIGLFTPSGICAGSLIWSSSASAYYVVAWSDNDQTSGVFEGFVDDEIIHYKLWDNSENKEHIATAIYTSGGPLFQLSKTYLMISSLTASCPVVTSSLTASATEDVVFTYTATATDPDGTIPTITFGNFPDWLAVSGNSISGTPLEGVLTATFDVTASDGVLSITKTVTITVTPVNDAPVITSTATLTATENTSWGYTVIATDVDDDVATLTYSISGEPTGMTISGNVISWTPATGVVTSGEITVSVNDDGGLSTSQKFTITVGLEDVTLTIDLKKGWNMISFNVLADDMTPQTVLNGVTGLVIIKNLDGKSYIPSQGVADLDALKETEAYYLYTTSDNDKIVLDGHRVDCEQTTIALKLGWNLLPYLPESEKDIATALGTITSSIEIVKDDAGNIYIPSLNVNNINLMKIGKGYKIYMNKANDFIYQK